MCCLAKHGMDASALISPGQKRNDFIINSYGFPFIIKYYIQGSVPKPNLTDSLGNLLNKIGLI